MCVCVCERTETLRERERAYSACAADTIENHVHAVYVDHTAELGELLRFEVARRGEMALR